MFKKADLKRDVVEVVNTDTLVPKDRLLRYIDQAVDFTRVYDFAEGLYCPDNGRPSVDPVVLIKMVFIQHLYGIPSLRQMVRDIDMNIAYRWFLGIPLNEPVPHFATISYAFRQRFTETTVEQIFAWIFSEVESSGYLKPEVVFVDAIHIKANANLKKKVKRAIFTADLQGSEGGLHFWIWHALLYCWRYNELLMSLFDPLYFYVN